MTTAEQGIRHFYTKVAGVSYPNEDGTSRQWIVRRCAMLEKLNLVHDEHNAHDPNAIRVLRGNGQQLGFLPAHVAPRVVADSAAGCRYAVFVNEKTGGSRGAETAGVNLLVVVAEPWVSEQAVADYLNQNFDDMTARLPGGAGCGTAAAAVVAFAALVAWL
jgi:hypothetical protein